MKAPDICCSEVRPVDDDEQQADEIAAEKQRETSHGHARGAGVPFDSRLAPLERRVVLCWIDGTSFPETTVEFEIAVEEVRV